MRYIVVLFAFFLLSCGPAQTGSIELKSGPHQHLALQRIKTLVPSTHYFEVHQWQGPDTLLSWPDTSISNPVLYQLDFDYKGKENRLMEKSAIIVFHAQVDTIIKADIFDRR